MTEKSKPKLGRLQKVVFDYVKAYPNVSSQQVGDALYAKTSSCACYGNGTGSMGGNSTPDMIRRNWATKLLGELKKKGLVRCDYGAAGAWWRIT